MSFISKVWKNRISQYPTRYRMIEDGGGTKLVYLIPDNGTVPEEGDIFDETTMNNLESRIETAIGEVQANLNNSNTSLTNTINDETVRAENAEAILTQNVSSLSTRISNEISRATTAENDLYQYVDNKISTTYKPSGSIYFADLPALDISRQGNVYDIKDDFTTTDDFTEGAGKPYPAGTNVGIVAIEEQSELVTYEEIIPEGTENPVEENWYELIDEEYTLSEDTTVDEEKTYYIQNISQQTTIVYKYDVMPGFIDTSLFAEKSYTYQTSDNAGTNINDTDYIPLSDKDGNTKKSLWSNIINKLSTLFVGKTDYASSSNYGIVKVDGTSITENNGVISAGSTGSGSVTSVGTGIGLTGGPITKTGTIKANLKDETISTLEATSKGSTTDREYAVGVDANGNLSVNVPWTDTQTKVQDNLTSSDNATDALSAKQGYLLANGSARDSTKSPTSHASSAMTYGIGNASNYGHVKLSDTYSSSVGAASNGIAASQKALYNVYCMIGAMERQVDGFVATTVIFNTDGSIRTNFANGNYILQTFPNNVITVEKLYNSSDTLLLTKTVSESNGNIVTTIS